MTRIPSLDGIRAIAVTLVLACHYGNDFGIPDFFNVGDLGVRIFFVISGFLITNLLLKELNRTGGIDLKRFYFRRTLRIFPAFYFYLGVMLLLSALELNHLTFRGALPALTYTSNYWNEWKFSGYVTSHTWSLATEEQFYLIWPVVLCVVGRSCALWVLLFAVVTSPILRGMVYFDDRYSTAGLGAFHVNMDHIGMGCLLAIAREKLHLIPAYRRMLDSAAFIFCPIFVVFATCQGNHPSIHRTALLFLINLSVALCIDWAVTHYKGRVGRKLNSRPMVAIGALSYSIYLWQQPFTHLWNKNSTLLLTGPWQALSNPLVSLPCIFVCAGVSYFLIERPSLRLRERIEARQPPEALGMTPNTTSTLV